jgi:hypothetical protein
LRKCSHKHWKELEARESIKKQIQFFFKSKALPMKRSLVKKQVMKAQSNKHRKAKQVQLQEFQHKEGKLNIIEMHKTLFPPLIITFSSIMNLYYLKRTKVFRIPHSAFRFVKH